MKKLQARYKGETFVMPWFVNDDESQRGKSIGRLDRVTFNGKVLACLIVGGLFEFCGSVCVLFSFQEALLANMNQGVSNSMITVSGVIIVVMSYILYKEHINFPQGVGIVFILVSIVLISLTKAETGLDSPAPLIVEEIIQTNTTTPVNSTAPTNSTTVAETTVASNSTEPAAVLRSFLEIEDVEADQHSAQVLAIASALLASVCFAGESLLIRYLASWGVTGEVAGFFYLFFEGLLGTACLVVYSAMGFGLFDYDVASVLLILLAGFAITGGVVLVNYSISIGNAGVCFSIANSNAALQALFTYLLFS